MLLVFPFSQNKPPDFVAERVFADVAALHDVYRFTDLHFASMQTFSRMIAIASQLTACSF